MNKFLTLFFAVIFVASFAVIVAGASHSNSQQTKGAIPEAASMLFGTGSSESVNWAGYAVTGTDITNVTGSFVVPSLTTTTSSSHGPHGGHNGPSNSPLSSSVIDMKNNGNSVAFGGNHGSSKTSYAAFWAGIDGYNSNTVEQAGVLMEDQNGVASYSVWYEFYPSSPVYATWSPQPGNHILVYVNYSSSNGTFLATVIDTTLSEKYVSPYTTVSGAARSSAEWIAEAPASGSTILPLADFGTVYFGSDYTGVNMGNYATVNGIFGNIGHLSDSGLSVYSLNMVTNSGQLKAQTSSLSSDGTSFYVTWESS